MLNGAAFELLKLFQTEYHCFFSFKRVDNKYEIFKRLLVISFNVYYFRKKT